MPKEIQVWDKKAGDGGAFIKMYSLSAKEAVQTDPERYSLDKPSDKPKPVEHIKPVVPPVDIAIPDNWQDLPWQERRKLAVSLGAEKKADNDVVNAIIAAELKRRPPAPPKLEPAYPPAEEN